MAELRVTPEVLDGQGDNLKQLSEDLQQVLNDVDIKINEIIDGWDGIGQDAYYDLYTQIKESIKDVPTIINNLGEGAKTAAKAYLDAEEAIKSATSK